MRKERKYRTWVYAGTWAHVFIYGQSASIYLIYACDSFSFLSWPDAHMRLFPPTRNVVKVELTQGTFTAANEMWFLVPRMKDSTWSHRDSKCKLIYIQMTNRSKLGHCPVTPESHQLQAWVSYKQYLDDIIVMSSYIMLINIMILSHAKPPRCIIQPI